jgi:hypothetical protein
MPEEHSINNNNANDGGNDQDLSSPVRQQQTQQQVYNSNETTSALSIAGDETPPRRITEIVEPAILGIPSATWEKRVHRKNRPGIPYPRSKSNGSTRSKNEESVTSSVFSVASGFVITGRTNQEDLEGLIVQTTPSQEELEEGDESSVQMSSSGLPASREKSQIGQLQALLLDLKHHLDKTMIDLRDQSRRDFEKGKARRIPLVV